MCIKPYKREQKLVNELQRAEVLASSHQETQLLSVAVGAMLSFNFQILANETSIKKIDAE